MNNIKEQSRKEDKNSSKKDETTKGYEELREETKEEMKEERNKNKEIVRKKKLKRFRKGAKLEIKQQFPCNQKPCRKLLGARCIRNKTETRPKVTITKPSRFHLKSHAHP